MSVAKSTSSTVQVFLMASRIHFVEDRILHRSQGQIQSRIQKHGKLRNGTYARAYWHASQDSGFSSEQATACCAGIWEVEVTVVFAIRVAGRERR